MIINAQSLREEKKIEESQLSSSSELNTAHSVRNARLNYVPEGDTTGVWTPANYQAHGEWIQVGKRRLF